MTDEKEPDNRKKDDSTKSDSTDADADAVAAPKYRRRIPFANVRLTTVETTGKKEGEKEPIPSDIKGSLRSKRDSTDNIIIASPPAIKETDYSSSSSRPFVVEGKIFFEYGLPAEKVRLRLYRREFGGKSTLVGETMTLEGGTYAFTFDSSKSNKPVSLEIRAVNGANEEEVPLSKPLNNLAHESSTVNLVAPSTLKPLEMEYKRLKDDLSKHIGQMSNLTDAKENTDQQDFTVLNRATGWDARLIALAAITERLSSDADVKLPQEGLYGLLRAGLPSNKIMLAHVSANVVEQALKKVREAGIIELNDQQIMQFKQQFETFSNNVRLSLPAPGSTSTYGKLLASSGLSGDAPTKFASVYLNHRGDAAELWENTRKAGLSESDISKLKLQGKMAFLAGNSEDVTTLLMKMRINGKPISDPVELVNLGLYKAERWKDEIKKAADNDEELNALIPSAYDGDKVQDRLDAYSNDMARKVRLSYPTQVIASVIEKDASDPFKLGSARASTAQLLKTAAEHGFQLGETPVESFFKTHQDIANKMVTELADAKERMKTLQRVYQITPTNESMSVLLELGLTSAYDAVAVPEEVFVDLYGTKFPTLDEARAVYRKAKQVSSISYNLFTIAKKIDSEVPVYALSATPDVRNSIKERLGSYYPTLESLLGSMDFCECEHCQSVLSPAAYLVDLLQFMDVDAEPNIWDNFLARWEENRKEKYTDKYKKPYDVLISRRPDLPNIQLTCENTHTVLPYIDIVNEILEYYVANGKLEEKAARDTGSAATEELLAEPQTVIREAYDRLIEARYPLNLPFDLWIETVRRFCEYFETPFAYLLEVFRPSDDLFAPTQQFDRATIFIESLGLSSAEASVFTDPDPLSKWYELYGFNTVADATTVAIDAASGQRVDLNSAKALSRRLGVTYKDLVEIVKTGFVNPKLDKVRILYKLGIAIHDVQFYLDHKGLLQRDPATLSAIEQEQRLEVEAFAQRLTTLADEFKVSQAQIEGDLQTIPFDEILVLADPDAGCNFDLTTLRYASGREADDIAFLRINLFVRLWRKLGWTIDEVDHALQAFIPKNVPFEKTNLNKQPVKTALVYLAHLKAVDENVRVGKQSRLKLTKLWSDIPITGKKPLYAELFLTRSMLKIDSVFDHPLGQYLSAEWISSMAETEKYRVHMEKVPAADKVDPAIFATEPQIELSYDPLQEVQHLVYKGVLSDAKKAALKALSSSPILHKLLDEVQAKGQDFVLIKGHLLALQGALGLGANEIGHILEDAGQSLDTSMLSLPNVSLLYRYGLLAKALKLSVLELISLKQLSGIDPFKLLHADLLTNIDDDYPFSHTLRFIELTKQIRDSGLEIEDLEYLLRHRFDEVGKYRPDPGGRLALLKILADRIRAIHADHGVPATPSAVSEEVLSQKLGLVLPPDIVERFIAMMNGTAEFTATKSGVAPGSQLEPKDFASEPAIREVHHDVTRHEQKLTVRIFDPHRAGLETRHPSALFADLMKDVLSQARVFFDNQLKKQKLRLDEEVGFLRDVDFNMLFDPLKPLVKILPDDTEEQIEEKQKENDKINNDNQTQLQERRYRIAQAFLPYLQKRLIQQFIAQTMTAQVGAERALVEALLTDPRLLSISQPTGGGGGDGGGDDKRPLLDALAATAEGGITATFFSSPDGTGAAMKTVSLAEANVGLKDADGNPIKPPGANSARLEGYLEVPAPGAYRFYVALEKQNAEAMFRFAHLAEPILSGVAISDNYELGNGPDEYAELKPGVPYRFTLDLKNLNGGDGANMLVQGQTLPKDTLAQLTLYPVRVIESAERAIGLLTKALQLIQSLAVSEREMRYMLTHASDFDNLNLSKLLPTEKDDDTPASSVATIERFTQFLRLARYSRLKRNLASGTDDLIEIFEANEINDLDRVYQLIAKLTRRDDITVKATARAVLTIPSFASEKSLQRLWEALQVVERFGVAVTSLLGWVHIVSKTAAPEQRFAIARGIKESIKARFDSETWHRIAQPIFDKLRQRQRDALASFVMNRLGFDRMEQLYEYFLIDPGTEPVVQTSRIRLAIASVQLFIQRCLLNLETEVHPSAIINAKQWNWRKRYRVWEAQLKIFLFPENWLEPEFRDDKTHLFSELEGTLLQGDVSSDLVEDAFFNYLKKLDELARLDIVAMHLEIKESPADNTLHVIGRTFSQPHKYFYRRYVHQMWTPWEPITVDIEGDHIVPVIWRERLYLFWVTLADTAKPNEGPTEPVDPNKKIDVPDLEVRTEAQLHWSEYLNGEWSTRESGDAMPPESSIIRFKKIDHETVLVHVSKEVDQNGDLGISIHLTTDFDGVRTFYLAGRNGTPQPTSNYSSPPVHPYFENLLWPNATRYERLPEYIRHHIRSLPLNVTFNIRIHTEAGHDTKLEKTSVIFEPIDQRIDSYTLLTCNNKVSYSIPKSAYEEADAPNDVKEALERNEEEIVELMKPVFYQDGKHTFFIEPSVTERTLEQWDTWVSYTPVIEVGVMNPVALDSVVVISQVANGAYLPGIVEPGPVFPTNPESIKKIKSDQDWIANPTTGLVVDGELVGRGGRVSIEALHVSEVENAISKGDIMIVMPIDKVSNSVAANASESSTVTVATASSLEKTGLTHAAGSIDIVGAGGINPAVAMTTKKKNLRKSNSSSFSRAMVPGDDDRI